MGPRSAELHVRLRSLVGVVVGIAVIRRCLVPSQYVSLVVCGRASTGRERVVVVVAAPLYVHSRVAVLQENLELARTRHG